MLVLPSTGERLRLDLLETPLQPKVVALLAARQGGAAVCDRPSEARRLSGIRVLIVEDDSDCLEALVTLLELNGAEARGACCADAGRKVLAQFRPHVLISDLSMPGEDGFTFLGSVRALSRRDGGETPAVAFTAMSPTNAQERAQGAGFQAFLRKPHDVILLIPMVLQLFSTRLTP